MLKHRLPFSINWTWVFRGALSICDSVTISPGVGSLAFQGFIRVSSVALVVNCFVKVYGWLDFLNRNFDMGLPNQLQRNKVIICPSSLG